MAAAALAFVVIVFVAAIANAREFYAASRAFNLVEISVFVDANDITASRAFNFNEIVFAIAVAIAIIVAAVTVAVATVVFFFKSTEIFVDFFDVRIEIFGIFLEACDFLCDIAENVEDRIYNLVINRKTFCKTFDVCNFFRNVHCYSSFLFEFIGLNWKYFPIIGTADN
jgi:hypothetical protein